MIIPLVGKFAGSLLGTWVARQDVFSLLVLVMIAYIALVPQSTMTIREFVDDWVLPNQQDYVVIDDGAVAGVASLAGLRAVPAGSWADTRLTGLPLREPPHAEPQEPIDEVLKRDRSPALGDTGPGRRRRVVGTVTSHDILDLVMLMDEIAGELEQRGAGDPPARSQGRSRKPPGPGAGPAQAISERRKAALAAMKASSANRASSARSVEASSSTAPAESCSRKRGIASTGTGRSDRPGTSPKRW